MQIYSPEQMVDVSRYLWPLILVEFAELFESALVAMPQPPNDAARIAGIAALSLSMGFGGAEISIPVDRTDSPREKWPRTAREIYDVLRIGITGIECAPPEDIALALTSALCRSFGGEDVRIPTAKVLTMCVRNKAIVADRARGLTIRALCIRYGLGNRTIEGVLSDAKS